MPIWFFKFRREEVVQSERRGNHVHTTILRKKQYKSYGPICQTRYGKILLFFKMLINQELFLAQTTFFFSI
jgi:hypothetical protein